MEMQYYPVSVDEAIQAGKFKLLYIPLGIILLFQLPSVLIHFGQVFCNHSNVFNFSSYVLYFCIGPIGLLGALCWRLAHTTQWKIWAYGQVSDIHRLQQRAEAANILFPKGSWLDRAAFKNAAQREELITLEKRFEEPRRFENEPTSPSFGVPDPTIADLPPFVEIPFSYRSLLFPFALVVGLSYLMNGGSDVFGPLLVFGLFFGIIFLFNYLSNLKSPYALRISNSGFDIGGKGEISWSEVQHIRLENRSSGRSSVTYLVYETTDKKNPSIDLSYVKGDDSNIERMCYAYWSAWQRTSPRQ